MQSNENNENKTQSPWKNLEGWPFCSRISISLARETKFERVLEERENAQINCENTINYSVF